VSSFDVDYFERAYGDYERSTPPRKVQAYASFIRAHAGGGRLLEIGCAYGIYSAALARDFEVVATDVGPGVIERARASYGSSGVDFRCGDVRELGLPERSFDAIVALDVLEHLPDLDDMLGALAKLLKAGGRLFASVPVYDGPLGPVVQRLDRDPTHIHKWSRHRWRSRLGTRPFEVVAELGMIRYALGSHYLFFADPRISMFAPAILFAARLDA
jgi:SAM-dependent methyltransferase